MSFVITENLKKDVAKTLAEKNMSEPTQRDIEAALLELQQEFETLEKIHRSGVERLVFSGGGAKGVVYSGAFRALVDSGVMQNVKEISGSSVGSVAATLLAVGLNPDEMRRVFDNDLTALLGDRVGNLIGKNPAGTRFFSRSTERGYAMVREQVCNAITSYFDGIENKETFISQYPDKTDKLKKILQKVTKINGEFPVCTVDGINTTEYPVITFDDLNVLHQIDNQRFKKLIMTATKHPSCELQIFSAEETPNVEIALAVCASCCIPGFFTPVNIPGLSTNQWVDGGVYDNMPEGYFDRDDSGQLCNKKKAQTLLFAFVESHSLDENDVFDAIHHNSKSYESGWMQWFLFDVIMMKLAELEPNFTMHSKHEEAYRRMREDYTLRTVHLNTASIGPLSFKNATLSSKVLFALGYFDTITYVTNQNLHELQCTSAFDVKKLHETILNYFEVIYRAVLSGAQQNLEGDQLLKGMNAKNENGSFKFTLAERMDMIKSKVVGDIFSPSAFALSRALELYMEKITPATLFKETYEESFKRGGYFSPAHVFGETVFSTGVLRQTLHGRSMFDLYHQQSQMALETRLHNVFTHLNELTVFKEAYVHYSPQPESDDEQEQPMYYNLQLLGLFITTLGVAAIAAAAFVVLNAATLGVPGIALAIAGGMLSFVGYGMFMDAKNQFLPESQLRPESQFSVSLAQP